MDLSLYVYERHITCTHARTVQWHSISQPIMMAMIICRRGIVDWAHSHGKRCPKRTLFFRFYLILIWSLWPELFEQCFRSLYWRHRCGNSSYSIPILFSSRGLARVRVLFRYSSVRAWIRWSVDACEVVHCPFFKNLDCDLENPTLTNKRRTFLQTSTTLLWSVLHFARIFGASLCWFRFVEIISFSFGHLRQFLVEVNKARHDGCTRIPWIWLCSHRFCCRIFRKRAWKVSRSLCSESRRLKRIEKLTEWRERVLEHCSKACEIAIKILTNLLNSEFNGWGSQIFSKADFWWKYF